MKKVRSTLKTTAKNSINFLLVVNFYQLLDSFRIVALKKIQCWYSCFQFDNV